jgi:hypothetical protein
MTLVQYMLPHTTSHRAKESMIQLIADYDEGAYNLTESERRIARAWLRKPHARYLLHTAAGPRTICAWAKSCATVCLVDSGMLGIVPGDVQVERRYRLSTARGAMLWRTLMWLHLPRYWRRHARREISNAVKTAKRKGLRLAVRPNGTSDLHEMTEIIAESFPDVQVYDYTKDWAYENHQSNVHMTYSWQEGVTPEQTRDRLSGGHSVTFLYDGVGLDEASWRFQAKYANLPGTRYGMVNGDESDARFLDTPDPEYGSIVALKAKGPARNADVKFIAIRQEAA